jgi:hypothetical protein
MNTEVCIMVQEKHHIYHQDIEKKKKSVKVNLVEEVVPGVNPGNEEDIKVA